MEVSSLWYTTVWGRWFIYYIIVFQAPLVDDSVRNQSVEAMQRSHMIWAEGSALNSPVVGESWDMVS